MTFDWTKYNSVAQILIEQAANHSDSVMREALLRSAISRIYYAVYRTARNYLLIKNLYYPLQPDNDHGYVREQFWDRHNPRKNQVADDLRKLRIDRNMADYEDDIRLNLKELAKIAEHNMVISRRAVANLQRLSNQK